MARPRAETRPCYGAPSCGHKPLQGPSLPLDLSCPSSLGFPKPLGPGCSKHLAGCGPSTLPQMHTMRLAEKGSCVPTLPRPRVVRGQAVKPDLRECEVLSKSSQVTSAVFTASPNLFLGL